MIFAANTIADRACIVFYGAMVGCINQVAQAMASKSNRFFSR